MSTIGKHVGVAANNFQFLQYCFHCPSTTDVSELIKSVNRSFSSRKNFNNPSSPTMYDCRKYGHNLPVNSTMPPFEPLAGFPTGIFRITSGEVLGAGANKCAYYQNPEYFSFHHMTFYDMHLILRSYRQTCAKTGRKP